MCDVKNLPPNIKEQLIQALAKSESTTYKPRHVSVDDKKLNFDDEISLNNELANQNKLVIKKIASEYNLQLTERGELTQEMIDQLMG